MRNLALGDAGPEVSPTPLRGRLGDPLVIVRLSLERTVTKSFPFLTKVDEPSKVRPAGVEQQPGGPSNSNLGQDCG